MKKTLILIGSLVLIAIVAAFFFSSPTGNAVSDTQTISQSELSKHNSESDCWVSYGNEVYDITSFLPNHPGGSQAILPFCGTSKDFENAFNTKHGADNSYKIPKVGTFKGTLG